MADENGRRPACPKCGSDSVAAILWGMPAYSEQLESDLEEGRVVLGGCCVTGDDPEWHCNACGREWGHCDILSQ